MSQDVHRASVGQDRETVLLDVLRTCLDNDEVGRDDNFFAAGGDSLLALNVIAMARDRGLRIDLNDVLTSGTVADLVELAEAVPLPAGDTGAATDPFAGFDELDRASMPAGVVAAQPASALQTGLIYLAELGVDRKPYNDFLGLRVHGELDERALRRALGQLMRRHRALRSSFDLDTFSRPAQLVWADVEPPLVVETEHAEEQAGERVAAWQRTVLAEGIGWERPPAFRCQAVAAPGAFWLTLAVHHSIVDGWSFALCLVELMMLYDAEVGTGAVDLPPVPETGHADAVALEGSSADSAESAEFWRAEAEAPPLLFDRRSAVADPESTRSLPIPPGRLADLRAAAARMRVPLKSLLLAAHGWTLGRWTGRSSVVTGLVVDERPEITGADRLVGLYLNTVPVHLRSVVGDWADLIAGAVTAERRVLPHRRYPLARIEHILGRPPFDVSFNFAHFRSYAELDRLRAVRVDSWWGYDKATLPMLVSAGVDLPRIGTGLRVAFDPAYLAVDRIDEFLAIMDQALDSIVRG